MRGDARIEGVELHQCFLSDMYVGDLVDGYLGFDDQWRVFGHDVHQRFAWPHDAALGVDLEPHHAAFHGRNDLKSLFGVLQGADTFTGLEDFVVQLAKLIGGFFNETVFRVLNAQKQFGLFLAGLGDGLLHAPSVALVTGQHSFEFQYL